MPQSRKRHGHTYHKPADIPAKQRTRGRIIWALLFSVFGLIIAFSAAGSNYVALVIGTVLGGALGYFIGRRMEEEAKKD